MERILFANELKEADRRTIEEIGIPGAVLMERAALAVARELCDGGYDLSSPLILCGPGNNGGDGLALARILRERGLEPRVFCFGDPEKRSEDFKKQLAVLSALGLRTEDVFSPTGATVLVGALYGIGLRRPLEGEGAALVNAVNESGLPVVAVDIPSGLMPDGGAQAGPAVRAEATVTFTAATPGLYLAPGTANCGKVVVAPIGIPLPEAEAGLWALDDCDLAELKERKPFGNKGTYGKLLVIAGSEEISGAAYLTAMAALRTGIGMVKILTHKANREPLAKLMPEALISTYDETSWTAGLLAEELAWADGAVVGPGLGTGALSKRVLCDYLERSELPTVLDADALNILAEEPSLFLKLKQPAILTPHVGEMGRLAKKTADEIKSDPIGLARAFAKEKNCVLVLKDARTVTAGPDGTAYLNVSGNSALATAGSGDVLAGILGGLCLRDPGLAAKTAATGVFLHGRSGEAASRKRGKAGVIASDLFEEMCNFM